MAKSKQATWPADHVERRTVADLVPYAQNVRTHSEHQIEQIAKSIGEWGWTVPVLIDPDGGIIAGHGRILAAQAIGIAEVPCMVADGWTEAQKRAYVIADNKLAENAGWDDDLLRVELGDLAGLDFDLDLIGFDDLEIVSFLADKTAGETDPDDVLEVADRAITAKRDTWLLGNHRLRCGSAADRDSALFFVGADLVCTDPPYCSGGFQEANRSSGSVGVRDEKKKVANDRLSTAGYRSLMRDAVFGIDAPFFYVFTDWRMWSHLFDISEAAGASVRSMVVWDKGNAGLGLGWRPRHELVLWSARAAPPYQKGFGGAGNVVAVARQPNELHTTQKPVEVVQALLENTPFAKIVADPFCGSGTTIIAGEMEDRHVYAMELDERYVDVAVRRWEAFTGAEATLEGDGRTFAEIAASRAQEAA